MDRRLRVGAAPPALEWRAIRLDLGGFRLHDVSLQLLPGEWLALVGPTGAGKTLLLEIAAGFLKPASGEILRAGRPANDLPPEERRIAYVPQDDLLFPHLDVEGNLLFAARRRARSADDVRRDLAAIASDLGIAHLMGRRVQGISGGEAQRVALCRALTTGFDTLLLDECTSALDETTRFDVGEFLARRRTQHGLSIVQVTHDLGEAARTADRFVRLDGGRIVGVEDRARRPTRRIAQPPQGGGG